MRTLQITGDTPEAIKFFDFACTLPFVQEKKAKQIVTEDEFRPMTMVEYNAMIDEALADIRAGRTISQDNLEKEILTW
jgi:hypothetical protein